MPRKRGKRGRGGKGKQPQHAPAQDWHREELPPGRTTTSRPVQAQLTNEPVNSAEGAWRNGEPPKCIVRIPQELILYGGLDHQHFAEIARNAKAFVFEHGKDANGTFGIWADSPEKARAVLQTINNWIGRESTSKSAAATSTFGRMRNLTNKELDKAARHWEREVRLHRFRQMPLSGTMFEAVGTFHWPANESPRDTLGPNLEALDSIRRAVCCYIFTDTGSTIHVLGNLKSVQSGLVRIRKAYRSLKARELVPARMYLLHWDTTRGSPDNIHLRPYQPTRYTPEGKSHSGGMSYYAGGWRADDTSHEAHRQALQTIEASVDDTLKTVRYYIGDITFRIRLGTFVATTYLPAEDNHQEFGDFVDMIQQSQFSGETTNEIGNRTIENTVLDTLRNASKLLEPSEMMLENLSDVQPLYTAVFHFGLPGADYELTMVWEAFYDEDNRETIFCARRPSWAKLDSDTGLPAQLLNANLLRLDTGLAWHFDMQATDEIKEHRVPDKLKPFEARVSLDRDVLRNKAKKGPPTPFVKFGAGNYGLKWVKCRSTRTYRLKQCNYLLDVSRWQRWEYSQPKPPYPQSTTKVSEARWGLAVHHTQWDKMLGGNRSLRVGERADWDDNVETWFPNEGPIDDHGSIKGGLQYLMGRLMEVEATVM